MGIMDTLFGSGPSVDKSGMYEAQAKAQENLQKAVQELQKVDLPDIRRQELELELPKLLGQLEALKAGDTELAGISTDPELKQAQMQALRELQTRGIQGLSEADLAKYRQAAQQAAAQNTAQQAAILRQQAQMGQASSGGSLAQKLLASQASANQLANQGDQIAQESINARQQALQQAAQQAAQMEGTDYARKSQVASARDAINQFNLTNKQNVASANYQNQQNMANQITNAKNQQQQYNKQLEQQNFANQMAKQGAMAGAYTNQANMLNAQAPSLINKTTGTGGLAPLLGTVGGAVIGGMATGGNPAGAAAGASIGQVAGQYGSQQYQGSSTYKDGGLVYPTAKFTPSALNFDQSGNIVGQESVFGFENEGNVAFKDGGIAQNPVLKSILERRANKPVIKAAGGFNGQQEDIDPQTGLPRSLLSTLAKRSEQAQAQSATMPKTDSVLQSLANSRGFEVGADSDVKTLDQQNQSNVAQGMDKVGTEAIKADDNSAAWASGLGAIAGQVGKDIAQARASKEANMMDSTQASPAFTPVNLNTFQPTTLNKDFQPIQFAEGGVADQAVDMSPILKDKYSKEYVQTAYEDGGPIVRPPVKAKVNEMDRAGNLTDFSTVYGSGTLTPAEKKILSTRIHHKANEFACGGTAKKKNFEEGGVQDGNSYVGDRVDAKINSGEMVLNLEQQQRLFDLLDGKTDKIEDKPVVREAKPEETNQHDKIMELEGKIAELEKLLTSVAK